jgi:hypothetical protein
MAESRWQRAESAERRHPPENDPCVIAAVGRSVGAEKSRAAISISSQKKAYPMRAFPPVFYHSTENSFPKVPVNEKSDHH